MVQNKYPASNKFEWNYSFLGSYRQRYRLIIIQHIIIKGGFEIYKNSEWVNDLQQDLVLYKAPCINLLQNFNAAGTFTVKCWRIWNSLKVFSLKLCIAVIARVWASPSIKICHDSRFKIDLLTLLTRKIFNIYGHKK